MHCPYSVTSVLIFEELFPTIGLNGGMEVRQRHTFAAYFLMCAAAVLGCYGMKASARKAKRH